MGKHSKIEWTDSTWNPVVGCSLVSPGCTNCYAMRTAARLERLGLAKYRDLTREVNGHPVWTGTVRLDEKTLTDPLRWRAPERIFVNSMSDLFHEDLPDEAIDRVFAVMALAPQHTFQVLTKRPERMRAYMLGPWPESGVAARIGSATWELAAHRSQLPTPPTVYEVPLGPRLPSGWPEFGWRRVLKDWPLPNVWLGVSVEDQERADERIPLLLETPAAKRFLSCEPLLGPVHLRMPDGDECPHARRPDWVIAGGESGPGARPMHPDWARSLRDQCQVAAVPFFFKQWGEWTPGVNVERQQGIVETARWFDGGWRGGRENLAWDEGHIDDEPDVYRVGKRAAGRLLDGRTWDEIPQETR